MRLALVPAVVAGRGAASGLSERVAAACWAKADCGRAQRKRTTGPLSMEKTPGDEVRSNGDSGRCIPNGFSRRAGDAGDKTGRGGKEKPASKPVQVGKDLRSIMTVGTAESNIYDVKIEETSMEDGQGRFALTVASARRSFAPERQRSSLRLRAGRGKCRADARPLQDWRQLRRISGRRTTSRCSRWRVWSRLYKLSA